MKPAPIVLFVYNRPYHTRQTVEALRKNELASESKLVIYSDAPKNSEAKQSVQEVREYIKSIAGFKKVTIVEREKNWGLAANIIDGVTKIVNEYGKIIVLEDDLVTSPYFLKFMNEALEFYQDEKRVWHISGWNYPIEADTSDGAFLWRVMNCWGWATWADRWRNYEKDVDKLIGSFSKEDIKRFNLDGIENFWEQVLENQKGEIDTWAIFWYASIFKHNGLCVNPVQSYVDNIGHDGSGTHCDDGGYCEMIVLNHHKSICFESEIYENKMIVDKVKHFYSKQKKPFIIRSINKISRMLTGRNLIS